MPYSLAEAARIAGGRTVGPGADLRVERFAFDSRLVTLAHGTCFLALQGPRRSGARYVSELHGRGVGLFCVSVSDYRRGLPEGATYWIVPDVLTALQTLAAHHRGTFAGAVVGVTGSNGKTIVKEWLHALLGGTGGGSYRSPTSYNSQLGVALSVLGIPAFAKTAVIEAGISRSGEMATLARMVRPTHGVFTMLGDAHAGGFASREQKLGEKLQLFAGAECVIVQREVAETHPDSFAALAETAELVTWSAEEAAAAFADLDVDYADQASRQNLANALWAARALGVSDEPLAARLRALPQPRMRLSVAEGRAGLRIVDDSYTSDLDGLLAALDFLRQHTRAGARPVAVLGLDATPSPADLSRLGERLRTHHFATVLTVGESLRDLTVDAATPPVPVRDHAHALEVLRRLELRDTTLLLKAPRRYGLERVARAMRARRHEVRLEVSLGALAHNIAAYRARLEPSTRVCVMVKAQAYGTGGAEVAAFFAQRGVDYLAVAYLDEAIELRKAGTTLPIIVGNADASEVDALARFDLEPEVTTLAQLQAFGANAGLRLHLKVDTGMNRLGFAASGSGLSDVLARLPELTARVASVFSHLSASGDAAADEFSRKQDRRLRQAHARITEALGYRPFVHIANSAAAWRLPALQHDMVRLGIGVYGIGLGQIAPGALEPAHRLVAQVVQLRRVAAGEVVGYGLGGMADRDRTIAVVNVGYADGLRRQAGQGRYRLYVRGQPAATVGSVCMDFTMVDVSDVEGVAVGDEAEVFGRHQPVSALAQCYDTIAYEVFTGIGQRVRRLYFE